MSENIIRFAPKKFLSTFELPSDISSITLKTYKDPYMILTVPEGADHRSLMNNNIIKVLIYEDLVYLLENESDVPNEINVYTKKPTKKSLERSQEWTHEANPIEFSILHGNYVRSTKVLNVYIKITID